MKIITLLLAIAGLASAAHPTGIDSGPLWLDATTGRDFVIEQLMLDEAERRGMIDVTNDSHWEPDGTSKVLAQFHWPLPNVILGASASDQATLDAAAPHMHALAANGWNTVWSLEPLLGPIDVSAAVSDRDPTKEQVDSDRGLHYIRHGAPWASWVIVGGESGPRARPCNIEWIRSIVRQCHDAGVPCFVKQIGSHPRDRVGWAKNMNDSKGGDMAEWPEDLRVRELPDVLR